MAGDPRTFYLIKPGLGDSIAINRTIKVIGDGGDLYVVLVIDLDYKDDPSGQSQIIVFRKSYDSLDDATAEAKKQLALSFTDDFIHNNLSMI